MDGRGLDLTGIGLEGPEAYDRQVEQQESLQDPVGDADRIPDEVPAFVAHFMRASPAKLSPRLRPVKHDAVSQDPVGDADRIPDEVPAFVTHFMRARPAKLSPRLRPVKHEAVSQADQPGLAPAAEKQKRPKPRPLALPGSGPPPGAEPAPPLTPASQGSRRPLPTPASMISERSWGLRSERSLASSAASVVQEATQTGVQETAHFLIHWFGARRFDYENNELLTAREAVLRRQSPRARDMARELIQENFKVRRRSSSKDSNSSREVVAQRSDVDPSVTPPDAEHGSDPGSHELEREASDEVANRLSGSTESVKPVSGTRSTLCTDGTRTTSTTRSTISSMMRQAEGAFEGGQDFLMDAQTTGAYAVEDLVKQHRPWFIVAQVVLCFGFWVVFRFVDEQRVAGIESFFPGQTLVLLHRDCQDCRQEVWRWLTYQFTHVAVVHVLVNSYIALVAGLPLEGFHGLLRTAAIFNVGVFGGAAFHVVAMPHAPALAGMSAGCYALLSMHFGDLVMNWRQSRFRRAKLLLLVFLIASDVLSNMFIVPGQQEGMPKVSHASHLGGFVMGLLASILICRNLRVTNTDRALQGVAAFLSVGITIFIAVWLPQWPPKGLFDSSSWCWLRQANNLTTFGDRHWHCLRCQDDACVQGWSAEASLTRVSQVSCLQLGIWE